MQFARAAAVFRLQAGQIATSGFNILSRGRGYDLGVTRIIAQFSEEYAVMMHQLAGRKLGRPENGRPYDAAYRLSFRGARYSRR